MQAIPMFLGVPGASACVMDAAVPYSRAATEKYLADSSNLVDDGTNCSKDTALNMAKAAFLKTCNLLLNGDGTSSSTAVDTIRRKSSIFGISCTAALVSGIPKKGEHRAHVGIYTNSPEGGHGTVYSITLTKGLRDRAQEDALCSRLILDVVAKHVGLPLLPDSLLLSATHHDQLDPLHHSQTTEFVEVAHFPISDAVENVASRVSKHALYFSTGSRSDTGASFMCIENASLPAGTLVYPGSFNPLHDGHLSLVRSQLDLLERQFHARHKERNDATSVHSGSNIVFKPPLVVFEIGVVNADKPSLPRAEITRRLEQFHAHVNPLFGKWGVANFAVSLTSEPLFLGKAAIFPGCDFLIGADTMVRLINAKYYADATSAATTEARVGGTGTGSSAAPPAPPLDSERRRVANMVAALSSIAAKHCRFVVGGRVKAATVGGKTESVFETCEAILHGSYGDIAGTNTGRESISNSRVIDVLPRVVVDLFVNLTEEQFRLDLSSTELRSKGLTLQPAHLG